MLLEELHHYQAAESQNYEAEAMSTKSLSASLLWHVVEVVWESMTVLLL